MNFADYVNVILVSSERSVLSAVPDKNL